MPKRRQQPQRLPDNTPKLSRCALQFALAAIDPFNPAARGVCIPSDPSPPSQRVTCMFRGTAFVGTLGVGFIAYCAAVVNDARDTFFSQANWAGDGTPGTPLILSANNTKQSTVGQNMSGRNLPYVGSQLITGNNNDGQIIAARLVATSVRVRYTGTALNQSGQVYCYASPNHENAGAYSLTRISSLPEGSVDNNDRSYCCLNMSASNASDYLYAYQKEAGIGNVSNTDSAYPWSQGDNGFTSSLDDPASTTWTYDSGIQTTITNCASPIAIIYFTGVPGMSVAFEIIKHIEYTGPGVSQLTKVADSDPEGLAHVQATLSMMNQRRNENTYKKRNPWAIFRSSLVDLWKKMAPVAVPIAIDAVAALVI